MSKILKISGICFLLGVLVIAVWWSYLYYEYRQYLPEHPIYVESDQRDYNLFFPENSSRKPLDIVVYFPAGSAGSDGSLLVPQQQIWEGLAVKEGCMQRLKCGALEYTGLKGICLHLGKVLGVHSLTRHSSTTVFKS